MTDLRSLHGQRITGIDGWRWYSLRAHHGSPSGFVMKGGVAPLKTRGKNKGRPNWDKIDKATERELFVSNESHAAFCAAWSVETGLCVECTGGGKTLHSWHYVEGTKYNDCRVCGGTGEARNGK